MAVCKYIIYHMSFFSIWQNTLEVYQMKQFFSTIHYLVFPYFYFINNFITKRYYWQRQQKQLISVKSKLKAVIDWIFLFVFIIFCLLKCQCFFLFFSKIINFITTSQNKCFLFLLCKPVIPPPFMWITWITLCITHFLGFFGIFYVDNFFISLNNFFRHCKICAVCLKRFLTNFAFIILQRFLYKNHKIVQQFCSAHLYNCNNSIPFRLFSA